MASENPPVSRASSMKQWGGKILKTITVEPLMFMCVASAVFKFVVLPQFLLNTLCHRDYPASICSNITLPKYAEVQTKVQSSAAQWMLGLYSSSLSISLFVVPLLGSLADLIGKKRVLYIPVVFYTLQSIVYSILSYKGAALNPGYLVICTVLGGLSGDLVALTMLTCSCLSEITTDEQRTFRLTILDGMLNLSLCIFTFISGYVIMAVGYSYVFLVSVGIDILALICLTFFVPDDAVNFKQVPQASDAMQADCKSDRSEIPVPVGSGDVVGFSELPSGSKSQMKAGQEDDIGSGPDSPAKDEERDSENENEENSGKQDAKEASLNESETNRGDNNQNTDEVFNIKHEIERVQNEMEAKKNEIEATKPELEAKKAVGHLPSGKKFCMKSLLKECNPIRRFICLGRILKEQGDGKSIVVLLVILGCASMCVVGESLTIVLYITNHPFNMNAISVGNLISLQGLLRSVGGYLLMNLVFQRFLKWEDINVVSLSFVFNIVYFVLLGAANTTQILYGIQALNIFGPLAGPTLRSIISKKGDSESYGTILSIALTIDALSSFLVNILVNSTYATMAALYPGAFCFVLTGISVIGLVLSYVVRRYNVLTSSETQPTTEETKA